MGHLKSNKVRVTTCTLPVLLILLAIIALPTTTTTTTTATATATTTTTTTTGMAPLSHGTGMEAGEYRCCFFLVACLRHQCHVVGHR